MSPSIHTEAGFQFLFVMRDLRESPHVHVHGSSGDAKILLDPIKVERSRGFSRSELSKIVSIVEREKATFLRRWNSELERAGR